MSLQVIALVAIPSSAASYASRAIKEICEVKNNRELRNENIYI